jgi:hypothetical protein
MKGSAVCLPQWGGDPVVCHVYLVVVVVTAALLVFHIDGCTKCLCLSQTANVLACEVIVLLLLAP